jgi:hypothetical protein
VKYQGQPSAEEVAAAAAFVAAAQPALGPRVLLLAMFAAAGGHALLAHELAFTSHAHGRRFDPTHVFGMGENAADMIGWVWLLEARAAAAARRGHAAACCALLHDGTAM